MATDGRRQRLTTPRCHALEGDPMTRPHTTTDLIRAVSEILICRNTLALDYLIRTGAGWLQTEDETDAQ